MYYYKKKYNTTKSIKVIKCQSCMNFYDKSQFENSLYCQDCYCYKYNKKRCIKCELLRDLTDFKKDKECRGGHRATCIPCKNSNLNKKEEKEKGIK